MNLNEIKGNAILKGISMTQLSKKLGMNRRTMYLKISKKDIATLKAIRFFLKI